MQVQVWSFAHVIKCWSLIFFFFFKGSLSIFLHTLKYSKNYLLSSKCIIPQNCTRTKCSNPGTGRSLVSIHSPAMTDSEQFFCPTFQSAMASRAAWLCLRWNWQTPAVHDRAWIRTLVIKVSALWAKRTIWGLICLFVFLSKARSDLLMESAL